jgi:putative PEP-CTERM system TPR-repeat lipoprotein
MLCVFNRGIWGNAFLLLYLITSLIISKPAHAETQLNYEKALSAYKAQRFDESMIYLKNALQASPDNLPSKILMGQLLTQMGQYQTAEVEFSEAIIQGADIGLFAESWGLALLKLKEFNTIIDFKQFDNFSKSQLLSWQRIRANACILAKNYDCAKESFNSIGTLSKNQVEQFNGLANIALNQKNYPLALDYLTQANGIDVNNAITWQLKGLVARNQNNLELSLNYLQKAFELDPNDPYILRNLADVYLASNNNEAAKETINTILSASPDDPFAILVNSWLLKDTQLEPKAEAKFKELAVKINNYPSELVEQDQSLLFLRALVAFRQQNFEQAERDFGKLRKFDDSDLSPIIFLARSYIALNKEKDAIVLLEENQQVLSALPDVQVMLADLYIKNNKNFKAVWLQENLEREYPKNIQVKLLAAKLLIARDKLQEGMDSLEGLLKQYPKNETVLFVHSVFCLQIGQYEKANSSISELLKIHPNDAINLNIKSAALIKLNQLDEAQTYLNKTLALQPTLLSAKFNLASTYFSQNNLGKARQLLTEILQKDAKFNAALLMLADIQLTEKQYEEAKANYRLVLLNENQNIQALEGIVSVHLAKNELEEALVQLNKLTKLQSQNPKFVIQKAQIFLTLQDKAQSQKEIDSLSKMAQNNAPLLIALSKLQLLSGEVNDAISSFGKAQALQPKSLPLALQFAELLLNNNKTDAAAKQMKLIDKSFTADETTTFLKGRLAEQQGNVEQANQFYLKTLEINDQNELALAKLYGLVVQGYPKQIFEIKIKQLVSQYPQRYFPRNLLAQYFYYSGEYEQAAVQYELLLKHPELSNKPAMLNRLALVYMPINLAKSTQYAKQAFELEQTNPSILTTYGWLLTQQNQATQGLSFLRKALARSQQNPAIHYYIAVSLEKLGLVPEAISELKTLFSKQVEFAESTEAKALYKKLTEV